jgi:hypothetical protein
MAAHTCNAARIDTAHGPTGLPPIHNQKTSDTDKRYRIAAEALHHHRRRDRLAYANRQQRPLPFEGE